MCLDAASQLEDFGDRYYHGRRELVSWPLSVQHDRDGLIVNGEVDLSALAVVTAKTATTTRMTLENLWVLGKESLLARPLIELLRRIELGLPPIPAGESTCYDLTFGQCNCPLKVFRGPTTVHLGPHFTPAYSIEDKRPPEFGESIEQNIAYFWVMSARETLASQMCALSAVEYDGLPLAFYWDMAKQCWDEARHSMYFVYLAKTLSAENQSAEHSRSSVSDALFEAEGEGFPVPREGNFYEAMLNADLVQRLVLMNQRSEAPAIPMITRRLTSNFCRQYPSVAEFYEFDQTDETSHAAIGNRWLHHLVPDVSDRNELTEEADLLRGVLMLTAFAHHGGGSLVELTERFLR